MTACAGPRSSGPATRSITARQAFLEGDVERAAVEAKLALQDDPLDAGSHALLACLLAKEGQLDQAIVGFQRAWMVDPSHPTAAYNGGTMLLRREEAVLAARWLEAALSSRPDHVPSYNNLGKAYFLAGLPELAVAAYEEALRRDPSNESRSATC
jgi:Tfp pilus assembly protein PilF